MSELKLRKSICGVEVYEYLTDEEEAAIRHAFELEKEKCFDKFLLNPRTLLNKTRKKDIGPRHYRSVMVSEPDASTLLSGGNRELVMSWGTRYRGRLVLVAPKYPLGRFSGRAFAYVKIKTVKRERDGWRWHLLNVEKITPFFAEVRAEKGFFRLLISEGLD